MKTFPMFLSMTGRRVVIVGGGEQATQKCRLLLKTEARIEVFAQDLDVELSVLHSKKEIDWSTKAISSEIFKDTVLVFVATGCPGLDSAIHDLAKQAGAVVNVVDQPHLCDAMTPSIVDRDPVVVAIGTEGTAPVLARQIKTRVEEFLEPNLGELAALAGRFRSFAAQRLAPKARRDLWRWVFNGPVRAAHSKSGVGVAARLIKTAISTGAFEDAAPCPLAFVHVSPGAPDLITLRGVRRLQEADMIFYDHQVDVGVLELARRDAERVFVGKTKSRQAWSQDETGDALVRAVNDHRRVVRLTSHPIQASRPLTKEINALAVAGIELEFVPGTIPQKPPLDDLALVHSREAEQNARGFDERQRQVNSHSKDWLSQTKVGSTLQH